MYSTPKSKDLPPCMSARECVETLIDSASTDTEITLAKDELLSFIKVVETIGLWVKGDWDSIPL